MLYVKFCFVTWLFFQMANGESKFKADKLTEAHKNEAIGPTSDQKPAIDPNFILGQTKAQNPKLMETDVFHTTIKRSPAAGKM